MPLDKTKSGWHLNRRWTLKTMDAIKRLALAGYRSADISEEIFGDRDHDQEIAELCERNDIWIKD